MLYFKNISSAPRRISIGDKNEFLECIRRDLAGEETSKIISQPPVISQPPLIPKSPVNDPHSPADDGKIVPDEIHSPADDGKIVPDEIHSPADDRKIVPDEIQSPAKVDSEKGDDVVLIDSDKSDNDTDTLSTPESTPEKKKKKRKRVRIPPEEVKSRLDDEDEDEKDDEKERPVKIQRLEQKEMERLEEREMERVQTLERIAKRMSSMDIWDKYKSPDKKETDEEDPWEKKVPNEETKEHSKDESEGGLGKSPDKMETDKEDPLEEKVQNEENSNDESEGRLVISRVNISFLILN